MTGSTTLRRETRLLSVSGAWVRGTWIDDAVLAHCQRSANGGFGFRVRSAEVRRALVDAGLAVHDAGDPALLTGTRLAERVIEERSTTVPAHAVRIHPPAPDSPAAAATPFPAPQRGHHGAPTARTAAAEPFLGFCASSHHHLPVEAVVRGHRQRGAADAATESVALCARCADMLGSAGFFREA